MGFLKRIAGFLGFGRDEVNEEEEEDNNNGLNRVHTRQTGLPRKGFSVPVQLAVDRSLPGPILVPSLSSDGGVQGLRWYAKRLKVDEDGDVADEFFDEITPERSENERKSPEPARFRLKYSTRPARVTRQAVSQDGLFKQCVEHQGRLEWV